MAIFEQIPYTNLHNMNLDWLITKMKECISTVEQAVEDIPEIKEDIITLNNLVDALDTRITNVNAALSLRIDGAEATAEEALDLANYVDAQFGTKVDKRSGIGVEAYIHSGTVQSGVPIGDGSDSIPVRNSEGNLYVPAPLNNTDAANKRYVDAATYNSPVTDMLSGHEDIDDSYEFTASGVWSVYSSVAYKTVINMTDYPDIRNANVIRITIDGGVLVFTRNLGSDMTYECNDSDYRIVAAVSGDDLTSMQLIKYVTTAPATSTITAVGFSDAYAPMADFALKSEAQEFIFTVDGAPVQYKVVCVDD